MSKFALPQAPELSSPPLCALPFAVFGSSICKA